jgi:hypothetical protein
MIGVKGACCQFQIILDQRDKDRHQCYCTNYLQIVFSYLLDRLQLKMLQYCPLDVLLVS